MKLWWKDDETYDEIAVKIVSKCFKLARMKVCWDPEFEPSVDSEEIVDYHSLARRDYRTINDSYSYMAILSVCFLWQLVYNLGEFKFPI